ncbi:MAG: hypothetical protein KKB20_25765 [Proteobacteria bacterium]|nr:hypothetical protein [Pseudomonadota bacterium]
MENYFWYLGAWIVATVAAIVLTFSRRQEFPLLDKAYFRFISVPWKAFTFLIAISGMILIAPYTGDPTWDYFDAAGMAFLTYVTAPWSVGTFYRFIIKQASWIDLYIALCLMLFTSSWFYDGYILIRDGVYPVSWWSNLIISPTLYISGGLFWNLARGRGGGVRFAFQWEDWYRHDYETSAVKIIWVMIPFMLFAAFSILWFASDQMEAVWRHFF